MHLPPVQVTEHPSCLSLLLLQLRFHPRGVSVPWSQSQETKADGSLTVIALGETIPVQALMQGEPEPGKEKLVGRSSSSLAFNLAPPAPAPAQLRHLNIGNLRAPQRHTFCRQEMRFHIKHLPSPQGSFKAPLGFHSHQSL